MRGDPLPVDVRELSDGRRIQVGPLDRRLVVLDQLEDLGVVTVGADKVVSHSHPPGVESGQVAIVRPQLLRDLLSVGTPIARIEGAELCPCTGHAWRSGGWTRVAESTSIR